MHADVHQLRGRCRRTRGKLRCPAPFSHALRSRCLARRICCHCSRWPPGRLSGAHKAPNEFLVAFGDVAPANFGPCIFSSVVHGFRDSSVHSKDKVPDLNGK